MPEDHDNPDKTGHNTDSMHFHRYYWQHNTACRDAYCRLWYV